MIEFGRSARWFIDYHSEVEFCRMQGFDLLQVWYKDGFLLYDEMPEPKEKAFLKVNFPMIIHAAFTINDYVKYSEDLLRILKYLGHKEVIIHPSQYPLPVEKDSMIKLGVYSKSACKNLTILY